jgi:phytoene/squalene synthetase
MKVKVRIEELVLERGSSAQEGRIGTEAGTKLEHVLAEHGLQQQATKRVIDGINKQVSGAMITRGVR